MSHNPPNSHNPPSSMSSSMSRRARPTSKTQIEFYNDIPIKVQSIHQSISAVELDVKKALHGRAVKFTAWKYVDGGWASRIQVAGSVQSLGAR